jgi:hypothetical protein
MSVPVSTVDSLNDLCVQMLAAIEAALATTDAGVPGRQFVSAGTPAFDCCPFFCVHSLTLGLADTQPLFPPLEPAQRAHRASVNLAALHAYVIRCVPVSNDAGVPPAAADLTASGKAINQDGWAVWNHLKQAVRDKTLFPGTKTDVFFDGAVALDPAGGCGGWLFTVRVELGGIPA